MGLLANLIVFLLLGATAAVALAPLTLFESFWGRTLWILVAPFLSAATLAALAGALSRPFHSGVRSGRFPRCSSDPVYRARMFYGALWTAVYYCKPLYALILYCKPLKGLLLRGFGYAGSLDVTMHPDAWVRDLPLLDLGPGAYVANRATLGTNMCLKSGEILVGAIRVGRRSVVGHLAALGPGVHLGDDVEVGVGAMLGLRVRIGDGAEVGGTCRLGHGVRVGRGARLGTGCALGDRARIAAEVIVAPYSVIPAGARLQTQADAERYCPQPNAPAATGLLHVSGPISCVA